MSSTRFPGKVLEPLAAQPSIVYMVERVRRAQSLDAVVVVTSTDASDDPLAAALAAHAIECFRGELQDVLARYHAAALQAGATTVVRLTGDCPLVDPALVDAVVALRLAKDADYASNVDPPTFPDGFDIECFSMHALQRAFAEAAAPAEREHVTPWMRSSRAGLRRANVHGLVDLSHLRLTVDYADDLAVVRRVVDYCSRRDPHFDLYDVLRCLAGAPELMEMNRHARNEGFAKSAAAGAALGQPGKV
jgi:spore coat polysaccharide biosynthesis protein SpsF (cytidylyltransferase family)